MSEYHFSTANNGLQGDMPYLHIPMQYLYLNYLHWVHQDDDQWYRHDEHKEAVTLDVVRHRCNTHGAQTVGTGVR